MGPYGFVACDFPWRFEVRSRETGLGRAPDQHYDTMSVEQGMQIPVMTWTAKDSLLGMWVYDPMLPEAIALAEAWGFTFCTVLFRWFKTTEHPGQLALFPIEHEDPLMGLGYHTRAGGCEEMWLFKRGRGLKTIRRDIKREFFSLVREHSRKPDETYQFIADLYGNVPRLEMFARTRRPGWDAWGNETEKFAAAV